MKPCGSLTSLRLEQIRCHRRGALTAGAMATVGMTRCHRRHPLDCSVGLASPERKA